ncbi:hypothetical protein HS041_09330 [Planomonospora sp. ID67723]|uniref:hypothetical protein n=1 Tax=Planomonospora sp. ID67723 TaxID=2738134 RepID=UPI0018C353C4|nr:hypothetical protein [Planomonospora sp. ID67723]MBG0827968.1 hypothetical protein [Planomonospora sp. ID67723]
MATWFRRLPPDPEERASQGQARRGPGQEEQERKGRGREGNGGEGRLHLLLRTAAERLGRRGAERLAAAPATEKVVGGLHRAATGLAEVTSEVNAYAELLEEKADELRARTRTRRKSTGSG